MPVTGLFDIPSVDPGGGGGGSASVGGSDNYTSTGTVRRPSVWSEGVYHEQQEGMLCAMHAINNLLQKKTVDEVSLAEIGRRLDEEERKAMNAGVNPLEWSAGNRQQYLAENPENNVRADGFFGIQVIQTALQNMGLSMVPYGSEAAATARRDPGGCTGFIFNLHEHWYSVRRIGQHWFDLNSTHQRPQYVSETYIEMFLGMMQQQGYSIFVVEGAYPTVPLAANPAALAKAVAAHKNSSDAATWDRASGGGGGGGGGGAFSGAGHSMRSPPTASAGGGAMMMGGDEDADLAAAIAASLGQQTTGATAAAPPASMGGMGMGGAGDGGEDAELAAAIAASLADSASAAGTSAVAGGAGHELSQEDKMRQARLARFG